MDMGFSREHCTEALLFSSGLEQATEYCLTHPPPHHHHLQASLQQMVAGMDVGGESDEDQMMRAIAMSLGENIVMSMDEVGCFLF